MNLVLWRSQVSCCSSIQAAVAEPILIHGGKTGEVLTRIERSTPVAKLRLALVMPSSKVCLKDSNGIMVLHGSSNTARGHYQFFEAEAGKQLSQASLWLHQVRCSCGSWLSLATINSLQVSCNVCAGSADRVMSRITDSFPTWPHVQ